MWLSGSRFRNRIGTKGPIYLRYFSIPSSIGLRFASMLRWVMVTPLGSPVAPEVKRISATSSGAAATKEASAAALVSAPRRGQTGHANSDGACRSSPIRSALALTIPEIRSTIAADDRKSRGTAITPSRMHPQSATTHSGLFSPQKSTRSPFAIPVSRRRDANADAWRPAA